MKRKQNKRVTVFDEKGLVAFAAQLKKVRKDKGYTQEKLSDESGITLSQIARIETIKINPSLSTIFVLMRTLDIQPNEMFNFKLPK